MHVYRIMFHDRVIAEVRTELDLEGVKDSAARLFPVGAPIEEQS